MLTRIFHQRPPSVASDTCKDLARPSVSLGLRSYAILSPSLLSPLRLIQSIFPATYPHSVNVGPLSQAPRDLTAALRDLVIGFEKRIARLESDNALIINELGATRGVIINEREERDTLQESSSCAQLVVLVDDKVNRRPTPVHEGLQDELLDSLRKIQERNTTLVCMLRESEEHRVVLQNKLTSEQMSRKHVEDELTRILNTTPHRKQDLEFSFQDEIMQTEQSHMRDYTFPVSSNKSQKSQPERHDTHAAQSISTLDALRYNHIRLAASQQKCNVLAERIISLRRNINQCVDSASQALDVERALRADLEQRIQLLLDENLALKLSCDRMKGELDTCQRQVGSSRSVDGTEGLDVKDQTNSFLRTPPAVLKKTRHREYQDRDTEKSPSIRSLRTQDFSPIIRTPLSPESTSSTAIASPIATKQMSVIIAATLSKNAPATKCALKSDSTLYVDVTHTGEV